MQNNTATQLDSDAFAYASAVYASYRKIATANDFELRYRSVAYDAAYSVLMQGLYASTFVIEQAAWAISKRVVGEITVSETADHNMTRITSGHALHSLLAYVEQEAMTTFDGPVGLANIVKIVNVLGYDDLTSFIIDHPDCNAVSFDDQLHRDQFKQLYDVQCVTVTQNELIESINRKAGMTEQWHVALQAQLVTKGYKVYN
jgi:hypothetical protein